MAWSIKDLDVRLILSIVAEASTEDQSEIVDLACYIGHARRLLACGDDPALRAAFETAVAKLATVEAKDAFDEVDLDALLDNLRDAVTEPKLHPRPIFDALIDLDLVSGGAAEAGRDEIAKALRAGAQEILASHPEGVAEVTGMASRFKKRHGVNSDGFWGLIP